MGQNSYYISSGSNPVEFAELNVPFYVVFIKEMGSDAAYRRLWPGENLERIIKSLRRYDTEDRELENRKAKIISLYEMFYNELTGCPLK